MIPPKAASLNSATSLPEFDRSQKVLGVIPARLASTRLPGKVLRTIAGKPLLAWVYAAASACPQFDEVLIAADSTEVEELCRSNGWPCILTSPELPSGTDRLHAVAQQYAADIYVNVQGDEPMLEPAHIAALLAPFAHAHVEVTTLKVPCRAEDIDNPNAVKVVTATDGRALYFSRATIPYDRDRVGGVPTFKHLGLYAYRAAALQRFASLAPSALEQIERLEQLRLLENGLALYVAEAHRDTVGVDTEADLLRVEDWLLRRNQA
jgi:3-deoxy-manno-octulosonate cytidylyltransferase (CMP-KDO synthetase)